MARLVLDNGIVLPSEYSDDWYDDMTSNLTKLDEVIGSDGEKLDESDVGAAALSNDYDDLDNKPAYNVLRRAAVTLTAGGTGNYSDLDSTSKIKAGDYVLDAVNKLYSITAVDTANSTYTVSAAAIINITDKSELGAAALSNSYDDLNNLPSYGVTRLVNTAITDNSNVAFANISSVSKIAAGDFLLDTAGKMYLIASVDTVNETAAVTTPITQLALDSGVMHLSGNETVNGVKSFTDNIIAQTSINGLNPGVLSFPDLSAGLDISGYIDVSKTSEYTALLDGYISICGTASATNAIAIKDKNFEYAVTARALTISSVATTYILLPVLSNHTYEIICNAVSSIVWAKFFPNLGNV